MAKYKVTTAEGQTYIVETEEGGPSSHLKPGPQPTLPPHKMSGMDYVDALGQGMTMGFGDEIASAAGAGVQKLMGEGDFGKNYELNQRVQSDRRLLAEKNHPLATGATKMAGSLSSLVIPGMAPARGLRGAQALTNAMRTGAITGAVTGAGEAEGNRVAGAGLGAVVGAGVPAVLKGVSAPIRMGVQRVADVMGDNPFGRALGMLPGITAPGAQRGQEKVLEMLERQKLPLDEVNRRLAGFQGTNKEPMLADVTGEGGRRLTDSAMTLPIGAADEAADRLIGRANAAGSRISDDITEATGRSAAGGDRHLISNAIIEQRALKAAPLYDAAFAAPAAQAVNDPVIAEMLRRPIFQKATEKAYKNFRNVGIHLPPIFNAKGEIVNPPSLKTLDEIKKEVDLVVYKKVRDSKMSKTTETNLKRELYLFTEQLKDLVPEYRPALKEFSSATRLKEAMDKGVHFADLSPSEITTALGKLTTQDERDHFLIGAVDAIRNGIRPGDQRGINNARLGSDVYMKVFGDNTKQAQLKSLFHAPGAFDRFKENMEKEHIFRSTKDFIRGNSRTAQRLAGAEDMGLDPLVTGAQLATGNWTGPAMQFMANKAKGNARATAEHVVPLMTGDPLQAMAKLREAQQRLVREAQRPNHSAAPAGVWGGLLGGSLAGGLLGR